MIYVGYDTEIKQNFLFHDLHPPTYLQHYLSDYVIYGCSVLYAKAVSDVQFWTVHAE